MFDLLKINNVEEYFKVYSQRNPNGVYFCRIIGYDDETLRFLRKYQTFSQRKGTYINKTLENPSITDIKYLSSIISNNFELNTNCIRQDCCNWLKFINYNQQILISESIYTILIELSKSNNINIVRNAYIKFLYWLKYKFGNSIKYIGQDEVPKILYEGNIGKYEFYMLLILSKAGCDTIYVNFLSEDSYILADMEGKYSIKISKPIKQIPPIHFSKINLMATEEKEKILLNIKKLPYKINTNEWIKDDFFNEIYKENRVRNANNLDEINNMFIKYIGIDKKDEYCNRLYSMKKQLEQIKKNYIFVENGIQTPTLDEISKLRFAYNSKDDILFGVMKKINFSKDIKINKAIQIEFFNFIENLSDDNLSRIYNMVIKLMCWMERYAKKLFFNYNGINLPIFVLFGTCNYIEATFLCMLSKLPVDVLYINPNKDTIDIFNRINNKR